MRDEHVEPTVARLEQMKNELPEIQAKKPWITE